MPNLIWTARKSGGRTTGPERRLASSGLLRVRLQGSRSCMVFGEFLEGAGDAAAARDRFCQSYRADAVLAPAYARRFADDGLRTLREAERAGRSRARCCTLEMSARAREPGSARGARAAARRRQEKARVRRESHLREGATFTSSVNDNTQKVIT